MIALVIAVSLNLIDEAMDSVDITEPAGQLSQTALQQLGSGRVAAAVSEAWEKIRVLLHDVARRGWEAAQSEAELIGNYIGSVVEELEEEAEAFREMLASKLHTLMQEMTDKLLRSVRNRLLVGGDVYLLNAVTVQSKLVYSGSIDISLTALCKFVGTGEMVVTGTYGLAPPAITPAG
jgi:hypothetical protein